MAENDGELSFEPNQIITNGKSNTRLLIYFYMKEARNKIVLLQLRPLWNQAGWKVH